MRNNAAQIVPSMIKKVPSSWSHVLHGLIKIKVVITEVSFLVVFAYFYMLEERPLQIKLNKSKDYNPWTNPPSILAMMYWNPAREKGPNTNLYIHSHTEQVFWISYIARNHLQISVSYSNIFCLKGSLWSMYSLSITIISEIYLHLCMNNFFCINFYKSKIAIFHH